MFVNAPQVLTDSRPTNIEGKIVDSQEKLDALTKSLARAKVISFDTETTSTEEVKAEIVGISLSVQEGQGYYIPVGHTSGANLSLESVIHALIPSMTDARI